MAQTAKSVSRFSLASASILIVDGEQMHLDIMSQILLGFGARGITKCDSVAAAREAMERKTFQLAVVDPGTLGEDGYSFVPWIRRQKPPLRFMPVLVVTAYTPIAKIEAFRDSGAHLVLRKPVTPAAVHERIRWMIQDRRAYIESTLYAGPDRRFKEGPLPQGVKGRRAEDREGDYLMSSQRDLSQAEIDTIIKRGA